jgi:hypothetical protein
LNPSQNPGALAPDTKYSGQIDVDTLPPWE